jgi:hypothetical protein
MMAMGSVDWPKYHRHNGTLPWYLVPSLLDQHASNILIGLARHRHVSQLAHSALCSVPPLIGYSIRARTTLVVCDVRTKLLTGCDVVLLVRQTLGRRFGRREIPERRHRLFERRKGEEIRTLSRDHRRVKWTHEAFAL